VTTAPQGSQRKAADSTNDRVTISDAASITSGEPAVNALGRARLTTANSSSNQSGIKNPQRVALASLGSE
jgi:hypothetical protein